MLDVRPATPALRAARLVTPRAAAVLGQAIILGARDWIVLSYLKSCVREAITGGVIKIGIDQSDVQSAEIMRTKVDCGAGKMLLAPAQAYDAAGLIFRGRPLGGTRPKVGSSGS